MTSSIKDDTTNAMVAHTQWGEGTPWGRRADEPAEAYDAFFFYRSLFPSERTVGAAWRHMLGLRDPERLKRDRRKSAPANWAGWAVLYEWDVRAAAYDDDFRRKLVGTEEDALKEMVERHQTQLTTLQKKGMEHIDAEGFDTSAAALRAVLHSMEQERKIAGIPDVSQYLVMSPDSFKAEFAGLLELLAIANAQESDG